MILSDRDIRRAMSEGRIVIEPLADPDIQIQPASVDIRLGNEFRVFKHAKKELIDPAHDSKALNEYTELIRVGNGDSFIIQPGEFVLGRSIETIKVADDLVARLDGRSSMGRIALLVHATAGYIDPGFCGTVTLELSNVGKMPIALYPGQRIGQISFEQLSSPAERPYGEGRNSKYQGQVSPEASRINLDSEIKQKRLVP